MSVSVRPQNGGVCLTVADRGPGLSENWSVTPQGTRLGMKLVQAMLRQIGGEMRVEGGEGACFTVCA